MYIGGVLPTNEELYNLSVEPVNDRFDRHIPNIFFKGAYDPEMDTVLPSVPRKRFHYRTNGFVSLLQFSFGIEFE